MKLPEDVQNILNDYLEIFKIKLPGLMDSFYLIGSIAMNDYIEGKSDIDFVCLINRELNSSEINTIKRIHKEISSKYPENELEGTYITQKQIGKLDTGPVVHFDGKNIHYDTKSGNIGIITWFVLQKYGITVIGKSPEYYISYINPDDLVNYANLNANTYWSKWTERASKWSLYGFKTLFAQKVEWGVLGISRLYYTKREKDVISKYMAGEYVLKDIPPEFELILKEALRIRNGGVKSYYGSPFKRRKDIIAFMEYIIDKFKK